MTCAPLLQHTGLQEIHCYQKSLFISLDSPVLTPSSLKVSYCISLFPFFLFKQTVSLHLRLTLSLVFISSQSPWGIQLVQDQS